MNKMDDLQLTLDPDIWSGKTSPAHSAPTGEKISKLSSKKPSKLSNRKPPLFLCLAKDGQPQEVSWVTDGALHGACSMLNTGEHPREDVESHLSQILEVSPHPKYSLSAKACQGILRRAERRGKDLPPLLRNALEMQILSEHTAKVQKHTAYKETASTEPTPQDATVEGGRKV